MTEQTAAKPQSAASRLLGLALVLPAALLGLLTVLIPVGYTFYLSLQNFKLFSSAQFAGLQNYLHLFEQEGFVSALGNYARTAGLALLLVGFTAALVSLGAAWFGKTSRRIGRLVLGLPLAVFIPLFWFSAGRTLAGGPQNTFVSTTSLLVDPATAPWIFSLIVAGFAFSLVTAVSSMFYLSAARGQSNGRRLVGVAAITWLVGLLGILAVMLQDYLPALFLTNGGPARATETPGLLLYNITFRFMELGAGAAVAFILIVGAALFGLVATVLVAASGVSIRLGSNEQTPPRKATAGILMLIAGLLFFVPIALVSLANTGMALTGGETPAQTFAPGLHIVNSLLQILPVLLIQLPVTFLAALGIGGLRPLGKASEWLLLLFGGSLFLTILPLTPAGLKLVVAFDLVNTIPGLLLGSLVLNVPMLFILTLFFKGQHPAWRERVNSGGASFSAALKTMVLPALPLALVLTAAAAVVTLWEPAWAMVVTSQVDRMPLSSALLLASSSLTTTAGFLSAVSGFALPVMLVSILVLVPVQLFILDRLEIR